MSLTKSTKHWLKQNCPCTLSGRTVLVTGANSGVGFKTAETALYLGADVILACRSRELASQAKGKLLRDYPNASIRIRELDLASLASIDRFVETIRNEAIDIDAFVNNAGVFHQPGKITEDGFEMVLGTNYFGVYYLSEQLLSYLQSLSHPVVYINTISMIHQIARIDYEDFYGEKQYGNFLIYGRSKLCLAKYSFALAQRCRDTNVRVYMVHPGMVITPMGLNAFGKPVASLAPLLRPFFNSAEKSSLSLVWILSHDVPPGSFVGPAKGFGGWGWPEENRVQACVRNGADELLRFTEAELQKRQR